MKIRNKVMIPLLLALVTAGGCKKMLNVKSYDFVSPSQVHNPDQWVNGVLNTINGGAMWQYGAYPKVLDLDNDDITGPDWGMGDFGAGNFSAFWGMNAMWTGPYTLIDRANYAISQVQQLSVDEGVKANALGQLYFLRGWGYFLLVRAFGPVPYFDKSVNEGETQQHPRMAVDSVYGHIIADLQLAEQNLLGVQSPGYIKGRISKGAASTLLAKVYLTMASSATSGVTLMVMGGPATRIDPGTGKPVRISQPQPQVITKSAAVQGYEKIDPATYFKLARDKAKEIMESGDYSLFPTYTQIWIPASRNSVEHIWSLQAVSGDPVLGNGTSVDYAGVFAATIPASDIATGVPMVTNGKWYGIRDHWYEIFEKSDQRITDGVLHRWEDGNGFYHFYPEEDSAVVNGNDTSPEAKAKRQRYGYQPSDTYSGNICTLRKFMGVTNQTIDHQDFFFPFLRYADVLLMYAEAENEAAGPDAAAYDAMNQVRKRSGASVISGLTKDQFRSFILEERRREFGLEANRRWDMLRWGFYLQAMNAVDIDENNVLKRRQARNLWYPIPIDELSSNPYIPVNNAGW